jgi:hypothetical protein
MSLPTLARLPELDELLRLVEGLSEHGRVRVLGRCDVRGISLPIFSIALGSTDPEAPSLAFVGGVHGLERIGAQVVLAYLKTLTVRLSWDRVLHDLLERVRLLFVPLVNPGGMLLGTRANPRGVDLMRNAPRHPDSHGTFLLGGQRLSSRLPWYAGDPERGLELESRVLIDVVEREILPSRVAIAIDCHSGFGLVDRLWFPYARTRKAFPHLAEVVGIKKLLDQTLPNHVYKVEPQAQSYTIDGDLWDHLYDRSRALRPQSVFVPLTLEMGSWLWVRKNPWQLGSVYGGFNPLVPHRLRRTLRRHLPLFDLLLHAIASPEAWIARGEAERAMLEHHAYASWPFT